MTMITVVSLFVMAFLKVAPVVRDWGPTNRLHIAEAQIVEALARKALAEASLEEAKARKAMVSARRDELKLERWAAGELGPPPPSDSPG